MSFLGNFCEQVHLSSLIKRIQLARREKHNKDVMKISQICFSNVNNKYFFNFSFSFMCAQCYALKLDRISFSR